MSTNDPKWIRGDGGPLVVLQEHAALRWRGAVDSEQSLMQGGNVETDYDVICRCGDGISLIHRHERDMLVLSDSEWEACFVSLRPDEVVVLQWFGSDSDLNEMVRRLRSMRPSKTLDFAVCDTSLRLLVGADDGDGEMYGFSEVKVRPGQMVCEVYASKEAQLAALRPRN